MALFHKKPDTGSSAPFYTLGLHKTVLVIGLGNPGKKYDGTRHNIGFAAVDALAQSQDLTDWANKKDLKSLVVTGNVGSSRVILCKPTTFMNLSGEAVQAVSHFYKVAPDSIVVVHDELDIPFGQIRTRVGGSDAGHNGIKSLVAHIGEDFGRVRIGAGPKKPNQIESSDYVLAPFSETEQAQLPNLLKETTAILTEFIHGAELPHETRSFLI
jgi:peptidyl-tRNA hydrolase, PTH1 family